jgi:hypothetical protein
MEVVTLQSGFGTKIVEAYASSSADLNDSDESWSFVVRVLA